MSDLKTATSATPLVIESQYLAATETSQYTATSGTTVKISSLRLTNNDASGVSAQISLVKTGGSAGTSTRIFNRTLNAGESVDIGGFWLGPGDFISGIAGSASKISIAGSGVVFSSAGGGTTGVTYDATGTGARGTSTGTINWTHVIGSGSNRYLIVAFETNHTAWVNSWSDYDTLTCSSDVDGALTRLVSADVGPSGQKTATVHLFGKANPTNGSHVITCTVTDGTVGTFQEIIGGSASYTGVGGTSGAVAQSPTSAAVLSLAVTSALDNRPVVACRSENGPINFNRTPRYINGTNPLLLADALGASSVTFSNANGGFNGGAAINLVAA